MKYGGEEVLTYRSMLKYIKDELQNQSLTIKEIMDFIKSYERVYNDNPRILKTLRLNGKLTTFNVYRKFSIDKMIYYFNDPPIDIISSVKEILNKLKWYAIQDLSKINVLPRKDKSDTK